jgi:hypothetical protein
MAFERGRVSEGDIAFCSGSAIKEIDLNTSTSDWLACSLPDWPTTLARLLHCSGFFGSEIFEVVWWPPSRAISHPCGLTAAAQVQREAEARNERTLEAVAGSACRLGHPTCADAPHSMFSLTGWRLREASTAPPSGHCAEPRNNLFRARGYLILDATWGGHTP